MALETASLIYGLASTYTGFEQFFGPTAARFIILALGTALYAIIVGTFYKWLSKKELFRLKMDGKTQGWTGALKNAALVVFFLLKYAIVFPFITFIWFLFLTAFMIFLTQEQTVAQIMIIAIAIITATRITAYYDQEIAVDVGKTLPLTLLAVVLISPAVFSKEILAQKLTEMGSVLGETGPFLFFMVATEIVLRLLLALKRFTFRIFREGEPEKNSGEMK